jgi:hypothetical protein
MHDELHGTSMLVGTLRSKQCMTSGCLLWLVNRKAVLLHLLPCTGCLGMRLSTISKDIVAALLPLTTHKRHKTRIAAVEAVRDVMHLVRSSRHCWQTASYQLIQVTCRV